MAVNTSTIKMNLSKVEATLRSNFEIADWQGVRIILAIAAAHYLPGEPLWLRIIGGSRSGRTELLRALCKDHDSVPMEALAPASIRGGFKGGMRLLDRINGKRVITKDLAPLITSRRETRLEIFGLLRSVKDGTISSDFGTLEGHIFQEISFDWILAVTPAIEGVRQIESLLGERYIDLHWIPGNREEMAYRAANNNPNLEEIREQLATSVCRLLAKAKELSQEVEMVLPDKAQRKIAQYADVIALCRSPIQKDSRGNILAKPKPEIGTSLAQDFSRTALAIKLLGINGWKPYIERLAWNCLPSIRCMILQALATKPQSAKELHESTGLPLSTIYYHLTDLMILNVIRDDKRTPDKDDPKRLYLNLTQEQDPEVRKRLVVKMPPIPKKIA